MQQWAKGAPRGGPPLVATLAGGGAGRQAHDVGSADVPGGEPGLTQGTLPTDGTRNDMAIARRSSCSRLRVMWQASVGRWADACGGRGPRGGGLTTTGDVGRRRRRARAVRWPALVPLGDVAACRWPEGLRRRRARATRWSILLLLRRGLTQAAGGISAAGRRGCLWLARGLTKAASAGREAVDFIAIGTWADAGGKRLRCRVVAWPLVIGLRADTSDGCMLRGGGFTPTDDIVTWADIGRGRVLRGGRHYCRW